ncbi:MAG: DUF5398 family protein [Chlamydiae bacterium]|jgi:hypothetical protein|nr:DUF5398 family protein [Chlamydiota bacterium]
MYGLEKSPKAPFQFDLEIELKKDPSKAKVMLKSVDEKIQEIKNILRQGKATEDFDNYGILLNGYVALQKVLKKIEAKK